MQENSPYAAPESDITTQNSDETYQPQFFATNGRIGRLRYLAYIFGVYSIVAVIGGALVFAGMELSGDPGSTVTLVMMGLGYVALLIFVVILAKRRLNDLDMTGWLSLVLLIPIAGAFFALYMMFASGTGGSNKYGPAPCKNSTGIKILGLAFPVIAVIGILAAIAVPAYQEYVTRAAGV